MKHIGRNRGLLLAAALLAGSVGATARADPFDAAVATAGRSDAARALDQGRHPAEILRFSGIRPGQTVADFQAGGGYFTEMLANLVGPQGKVVALVPGKYFKADGWTPITTAHPNIVLQTPDSGAGMFLPPASVDVIFVHTVLHDLYLPPREGSPPAPKAAEFFANWFAALRPGGQVVVVDHIGLAGDTAKIAGTVHRIAPETVKADMIAAGFRLVGESDLLHRSEDDLSKPVFDPSVRGNTSRMMLRFQRP